MRDGFAVGVVSSLAASLLAWLFFRLIKDSLLPWYQRRVYRGVIVAGCWRGARTDSSAVYGFVLDLEQNGHRLAGRFTAENAKPDGSHTKKAFDLVGEITNNYILLNYTPADQHTYGSGAFLFQIFTAGRVLKGGMLYLRTKSGEVGAVSDITLERVIG